MQNFELAYPFFFKFHYNVDFDSVFWLQLTCQGDWMREWSHSLAYQHLNARIPNSFSPLSVWLHFFFGPERESNFFLQSLGFFSASARDLDTDCETQHAAVDMTKKESAFLRVRAMDRSACGGAGRWWTRTRDESAPDFLVDACELRFYSLARSVSLSTCARFRPKAFPRNDVTMRAFSIFSSSFVFGVGQLGQFF